MIKDTKELKYEKFVCPNKTKEEMQLIVDELNRKVREGTFKKEDLDVLKEETQED